MAKYATMKAQQLLVAESESSLAAEVTKVIEFEPRMSLEEEEPLLGDWMCDILKPSSNTTRSQSPSEDEKFGFTLEDRSRSINGKDSKPNSYVSLVSQILTWLAGQLDPIGADRWMGQFSKAAVNKEFTEIVGSFIKVVLSL